MANMSHVRTGGAPGEKDRGAPLGVLSRETTAAKAMATVERARARGAVARGLGKPKGPAACGFREAPHTP